MINIVLECFWQSSALEWSSKIGIKSVWALYSNKDVTWGTYRFYQWRQWGFI